MKRNSIFGVIVAAVLLVGCAQESQESKDAAAVDRQQQQYAAGQPVPAYDWSLERHMLIQLYDIRNSRVATHSLWRSHTGMIEDDCPSMGFGIPADASLTNPLKGSLYKPTTGTYEVVTVEQAEPNGIFASKNTSGTWVMCVGAGGVIEPIQVETKVTVYPYPVTVDYSTNRVTRNGESSVTITVAQ